MTQSYTITEVGPASAPISGHRAVKVGNDGSHWIEGLRCEDCGVFVANAALACRRCASRRPFAPVRAEGTGKLYSWAVIHRSYPGIAVPFVSAIVDLDGGMTIKGTLRDVDMASLRPGVAVRVVFDDACGARDSQGVPYVGFHFVPEEDANA